MHRKEAGRKIGFKTGQSNGGQEWLVKAEPRRFGRRGTSPQDWIFGGFFGPGDSQDARGPLGAGFGWPGAAVGKRRGLTGESSGEACIEQPGPVQKPELRLMREALPQEMAGPQRSP